MSAQPSTENFLATWGGLKAPLMWLLQRFLMLWVKASVSPEDIADLNIDESLPVCYVLDLDGVSNSLILRDVCHETGLPDSGGVLRINRRVGEKVSEHASNLQPRAPDPLHKEQSTLPATIYLRRLRGVMVRRADPRISEDLTAIIDAFDSNELEDVQFVPVSILWGRAPQKEDSLVKLLFSDNWSIAGRLRKLMIILVHGRSMLVNFSQPLSLRKVHAEEPQNGLMARKLSRIMRVHFRRVREAAIGPDLSHRRQIVESIIDTSSVRRAIEHEAATKNVSVSTLEKKARDYANEIAANYSHPFISIMETMLKWLWNSLYDGVQQNNFAAIQQAVAGREVVYVPCHRSHVDYLLLSYLLYTKGLVPPHIAAGINLNLPMIGPLLRKGGAFFIRRSFKGQVLYAAVFDAYLRANLSKGVAIEYFIEGTRSRSGKLLDPKGGMLSMTIKSYLKDQARPIIFVPIYIGYERLLEGNSYERELDGGAKKKESIWGLIKSLKLLRKNFGHVYVNFADPIPLETLLDKHSESWRDLQTKTDERLTKIDRLTRKVVPELGTKILVAINQSAAVNPVNLLALVLQATEKHALVVSDLESQIELYVDLLARVPYSPLVTIDENVIQAPIGKNVVHYGEEFEVLVRHSHALGDVIGLDPVNGRMLNYYRNNIKHLMVIPSIIACAFMSNRNLHKSQVIEFSTAMYSLARGEYFLQWDSSQVHSPIAHGIAELARLHLITTEGELLFRPLPDTKEIRQLDLLAHIFYGTVERYSVILNHLLAEKSGKIRQAELESRCRLEAERLTMLNRTADQEFFDLRSFRRVMASLLASEKLWKDENRNLCYGDELVTIGELVRTAVDVPVRRVSLHK